MHPEPQHLKNFARASQWRRGKKVLNSAFFTRFHRPGLERLLACHTFIHLIRTIGHHLDCLACCSVRIMGCLSAQSVKTLFAEPRIGGEQSVKNSGLLLREKAGRRGAARVVSSRGISNAGGVRRVPSRLGAGLTRRLFHYWTRHGASRGDFLNSDSRFLFARLTTQERFPQSGIVRATGRHPPPPRVAGPAEAQLAFTPVAPHFHAAEKGKYSADTTSR